MTPFAQSLTAFAVISKYIRRHEKQKWKARNEEELKKSAEDANKAEVIGRKRKKEWKIHESDNMKMER